MDLSAILNKKFNELNNIHNQEIKIYMEIIDLGLKFNNIPLATKYSEELLKRFTITPVKLKVAEVLSFSQPDRALNILNSVKDLQGIDKKYINYIKAMSYFTKGKYCEAFQLFNIKNSKEWIYREIAQNRCKNIKFNFNKCKFITDPATFLNYASILVKEAAYSGLVELGKWGKKHFQGEGFIKSSIMVAKGHLMLNHLSSAEKEIKHIATLVTNDPDFNMLIKCYDEAVGNVTKIYGNKNNCNIKGVNITVNVNAVNICKADEIKLKNGGNNILLTSDQGFGDNIMYYPFLAKFISEYGTNNNITLFIYKELFDLFKDLKDLGNVTFMKYLDENDTNKVLNSTFNFKGMVSDTSSLFKLYSIEELYDLQNKYNFENKNIKPSNKIAICWRTDFRNPDSINKSFNLEDFLSKIDFKNSNIISIQKGLTETEKKILDLYNIKYYDDELKTFKDTSEILSDVSKVITIDTSILHLACMKNIDTELILNRHIDCKFINKPWLYRNLIKIVK